MTMTPERFFDLFMEELETKKELFHYYKFLENKSSFHFRKNYFLERLRYVADMIDDPSKTVWDCGCGYGTTCLFLAMNGIKTHGTTLEFYFDKVQERYAYWNRYGDAGLFSCSYENLFDSHPPAGSFDQILIQDTLHHLEPINEALHILHKSLRPGGELVIVEENGANVIQQLKLFVRRGNKRIIEIWDEKLKKNILIGNENIRSLRHWEKLMDEAGFQIDPASVTYVRYYLPLVYRNADPSALLEKERTIQSKAGLRRDYLFFGLNFTARKA